MTILADIDPGFVACLATAIGSVVVAGMALAIRASLPDTPHDSRLTHNDDFSGY